MKFSQLSTELELDQKQFESCLESEKYLQKIQGYISVSPFHPVTGTPIFFIGTEDSNFEEINGAQPFETFKKVIDSFLARNQ